jgi:glutamate synthase (NADPH/NADH) large chain
MFVPNLRTDTPQNAPYGAERDACALILSVRKRGESTHGTLKRAVSALARMGHRTGFVDGEGDGSGVQTDIPRRLWARKLTQAGLRSSIATDPRFWVGHCFIPTSIDFQIFRDELVAYFNDAGLNLLIDQPGRTRPEALGRLARANAPTFWQVAGCADTPEVESRLFEVQTALEAKLPIHFASLSSFSVVYKARASVEALSHFYPDLLDRSYDTAMALCHARYSTNTVSNFERAQPFALLGHNGEINTINRFRQEAVQIGAALTPGNSDSQDVDHGLHTLCVRYGMDLIEAMEMVFPPVPYEVEALPPGLRTVYTRLRQAFGPFAQGPAAIIARYGDIVVSSVDALGLRPLWVIETEKEYIFSSERGAIPFDTMVRDARPLAPGEKTALIVNRGQNITVLEHADIRTYVMNQAFQREAPQLAERYWADSGQRSGKDSPARGGSGDLQVATQTSTAVEAAVLEVAPLPASVELPWHAAESARAVDTTVLAVTGWNREQLNEVKAMMQAGKDTVGSLGYDGPLAVLSQNRVNLADFYKETVAVVTNPAIDREREAEAFSTGTVVGMRPPIGAAPDTNDLIVALETPLLSGGHPVLGGEEIAREVAKALGTLSIEDLLAQFASQTAWLTLGVLPSEDVEGALDRLTSEAIEAAQTGMGCIVLDDSETLQEGLGWLDPHLAASATDRALRESDDEAQLRRKVGLVVRSASLRTLHDVALLCGVGADAVNPYAMLAVAIGADKPSTMLTDKRELIDAQHRLLKALTVGLEKVTSTIGCHELRGYGRAFSSIGLAPDLADSLGMPNYFGNDEIGLTWERLNRESDERGAELRGEGRSQVARVDRFYPKFWKKVRGIVRGEITIEEFATAHRDLMGEVPVALRDTLDVKGVSDTPDPARVDLNINGHDLPVLISAMSFGSQGEISYRAYAEAAARLNILCINGEGGELPDMLGCYTPHRGQQVASGRFGVNAAFLNSASVIEVKIGQGAKPGEGGLLPALKVVPRVAEARHTTPYVPLISPSNNHDLYSIEDLAQLIEELKTVNPSAKISVKLPVVPGIGVIAVGVAKAGADIINLTGYDGGTGAARRHALQYVGLPAEVGVIQAHRALNEAGLRHRVELWCDGGLKSGADAVKMILLGANRVGFGTLAMVAAGCTICRKCHDGNCHVGITTHIKSVEEAKERGLKSFEPRDFEQAVGGVMRVFQAIGEEMRWLAAQLGATSLQDLVGRADLLEQMRCLDRIDLSPMLVRVPPQPRLVSEPGVGRRLTRPRNNLTKIITDLMMDAIYDNEHEATYQDEVMAFDRALGAHLAGELVRQPELDDQVHELHLRFGPSSVGGNGFAAWVTDKIDILVEGGAQDGAAKSASGGRVAIMKGINHEGLRLDGSVGKSFAYGAQQGLFIVQGNADSRACIRLSGADVIFGGELLEPIDDSLGVSGMRANLKGFACEYMTSGRVIIMGDPGPYAFAGMTGGVVYQHLAPELGFDETALIRRLARGANVAIQPIDQDDVAQLQELLGHYVEALEQTDQYELAGHIGSLSEGTVLPQRFVKVVPVLT